MRKQKWVNYDDMIALRKEGWSYKDIATQLDCGSDLVKNMIKKRNPELSTIKVTHNTQSNSCIANHNTTRIDLPVEQLVSLRRLGWSKKQISYCFGCSGATIKSRLKEHFLNTGEDLSGYIHQTLDYPEAEVSQLYLQGTTIWDKSKETGVDVLTVVKQMVVKL